MTLEELLALPPRERDARAMCAVFGWQWLRDRKTNLCHLSPPPDGGDANGWEMSPQPDDPETFDKMFEVMDHWPDESERFVGWDRACVQYEKYGHRMKSGMPSPFTDAGDDYLVLVRVRETWSTNRLRLLDFGVSLDSIWVSRAKAAAWSSRQGHVFYQPGDYASAAILVLATKDPK